MQEIRRENGLLLQLVKSLEGEINSKNRQNQLLFSQYEQLANQNKSLANQNSSLIQENQTLKRAQTPKENYKYSYAILNSPRTEKLQAQISELTQQMARERNEAQQTLLHLQKITKQKEELNKIVLEMKKNSQEQSIDKSNQRIEYLQKDLWRKQKEMKELTLIMYAKDATASEISFKQQQKNRQIDLLKKEIQKLKGEKERDYKVNQQKRQNQQKKRIERIEQLQGMLEQANKKSNEERRNHKDQIQKIILKQNNQNNYQNEFKKLQHQYGQERNRSRQKIFNLQASVKQKQKQIQQLQKQLKTTSKKSQQLIEFADNQTNKLKEAVKNLQQLKQSIKKKCSSLSITRLQTLSIVFQQKKHEQIINQQPSKVQLEGQKIKLMGLKRQIQDCLSQLAQARQRLLQIEQFSSHYKEEISQSQRIKSILVSQIQKYDLKIKLMKSQIAQLQQKNQQFSQYLEKKNLQLYALDQSIQQKKIEKESIVNQSQSISKQTQILSQELKKLRQQIKQRSQMHLNIQKNVQEVGYQTVKFSSDKQKQQLRNQLEQMQQSTNSFMQILQNLQQQLRNKQTINEELQQKHEKCSIKLQSLQNCLRRVSELQIEKQQLSKLLEKYIDQCSQNKDRICELQSEILSRQAEKKQQSKQGPLRKQINAEQYTQMLNAVIEQIKSQHQSSMSKIQSKNILIQELQRRIQESQHHYQQQISTLRTSIATAQFETLDFHALSKKYRQHQTASSALPPKGLEESLEALREQIRRKDAIIQQLSLFKSKVQEEKQTVGLMNLSSICLNQTSNDGNQQICDKNQRPISNIISAESALEHHFNEQQGDCPSQMQLQNEQLHQTVQQLNYIIASLQKELVVLENHYNFEIIQLQKTLARTNAQVIALQRSVAQSNPKLCELDRLARDFCVRPEATRLSAKNTSRNRMNSPNPINLTFSGNYKVDLSQSITKLSKSSRISPPLKSSNIICQSVESSSQQLQQIRTNSSNPYIKKMTDQKGNLKFPSGGNWSIEQLRSVLQADHN